MLGNGDLCYVADGFSTNFTPYFSSAENQELTDAMIVKLARRISDPMDLISLVILGLDMKEEVLAHHLHDKKDNINMAAYEVFKTWKTSQPNRTVAFDKLCTALGHKDVDMESFIGEILQVKLKL